MQQQIWFLQVPPLDIYELLNPHFSTIRNCVPFQEVIFLKES